MARCQKSGGQAVLVIDISIRIRNHSEARYSRQFFKHFETGLQNFHISPELVDHRPGNSRTFIFLQKCDRSVQLCKNAARIDISHEEDRGVHKLSKPHIYYIIRLEIDLGGTAGTFDDNNIIFFSQAFIGM